MKKVVNLLFLFCLALVLVACSQEVDSATDTSKSNQNNKKSGETKIMKFGSINTSDRSITLAMNKFAEQVEKETNGGIKVEVFPDSQLGGERDNFEGLQLGSLQASIISTAVASSFSPDLGILDLPFLFKDNQTAYDVLDGEIGEKLLDQLTEQGVIGMNFWENGYRYLTTSTKEVRSPDDLKGLKIRTMESPIHLDMWKELGAQPTPMAFPELFSALQQGIVDGQENPYVVSATNRFYEVQDYLTVTQHVYGANMFLISEKFWDTLSDEEKEIITKAGEEAKEYQRVVEQEQAGEFLALLKEKGMKITELTEDEKQAFKDKVQPIYEKYSKLIGEELVNELIKAAN
ncbi:TRAP transporter substrate-binding protein [Sporosarcina luteola]|uniref:TRAP transporter substrate-binding protein n=1 Tax=Sporosarcina luteola TaxID=582850 RepID=UPI0020414664|nr:TRAP transporter substrate-binding protein [Sporosarcina luteola]MCM3711898.1 DctP family TRAP transporter solute-binding subunit [Sporosarcina luteola]